MPSEIERKFLVSELPHGTEGPGQRIEQGYLAISEAAEVRLRRAGGELTLTVKRGRGEVREEVELRLPREQFERIWPLCDGARLCKRRHLVELGDGLRAEVDVYEGELAGLRVAEVEFESEAAARSFEPPPWMGAELTGEERYANRRLATVGLETEPSAGGKMEGMAAEEKGDGYRLRHGETAAEGMRRLASKRAAKAVGRLRDAQGGDLAGAIHGTRKDLKKIRAILRLVRDELGEKAYRAENRDYRDAGRLLSASRDAEVKLATLTALGERFGDSLSQGQARAWAAALEAERDRVQAGEGDEERSEQAIGAIEAAAKRIPDWPLGSGSWELLEPGLTRGYRRGRQALARAREERRAEDVHELRKRVKDLWYQLRLLHDAWPGPLGATAEEAHRLADLLGDHHDLAVLGEDLRGREGAGDSRERTEALIAARQEELLDEAIGLGARLYAEKPKCLRRRLRACWRAWEAEEETG